jgi:hypothetical protein
MSKSMNSAHLDWIQHLVGWALAWLRGLQSGQHSVDWLGGQSWCGIRLAPSLCYSITLGGVPPFSAERRKHS